MSLDLTLYYDVTDLKDESHDVASFNVTHNLTKMASEAGIYEALWRPGDVLGYGGRAGDLVPRLRDGLKMLEAEPDKFRKHDSPNGWGTYENFILFVRGVLASCEKHPKAKVRAWV